MPKISAKRWRMGLLVATLTGLCTAFAVGVIVPTMTLKEGVLVCLGSIAKDILLWTKTHPVEDVSLDDEPKPPQPNA